MTKNLQNSKFVLVKNQYYGRVKLEIVYYGLYPIENLSDDNVNLKKILKYSVKILVPSNYILYFTLSDEVVEPVDGISKIIVLMLMKLLVLVFNPTMHL